MLGKGPTSGINGSFGSSEKKLDINFSKRNTIWVYIIIVIKVIFFVNGKEIFKFKAGNKNANFPTQFCLGSISNGFSALESGEVYLNWYVYDFSVDYNSIDKSDILNIHKYLMTKNNIK